MILKSDYYDFQLIFTTLLFYHQFFFSTSFFILFLKYLNIFWYIENFKLETAPFET